MKTVLTIAGSDCSGGAGIQADIKTITAHRLYAMSAVTALTAQNTTGIYGIMETTPQFLERQLYSIFSDIFPDAVKIGMVSNAELIEVIADNLKKYKPAHVILDPVITATSGSRLLEKAAQEVLKEKLVPMTELITPNIPEAEVFAEMSIESVEDMELAAVKIAARYKKAVLLKGGHGKNSADDLLYQNGHCRWYKGERINNPNTHGTGCTLSAAIASNLAVGCSLEDSIAYAKEYLTGALKAGLNLGKGNGPIEHTYWMEIHKKKEQNNEENEY